jgi:ABC-2 type transport system ATP-binding protein
MNDHVIKIRNLSKFMSQKPIVLDMSLDIPKGTLFGLLGPNGAGKTTSIRLITGRLRPTSGTIDVLGLTPWRDRVKIFQKVGYLAQNPSFPKDSTVLKFITYMAKLRGFNRQEALLEARFKLSQVGLERFEQSIVGKLSGGEQQRLGFANCMIGDPEILILDEPTSSLDPEGRVYVMELIAKLAKDNNQTVIVSSHILPEIQRMTNHIAIMSEGRVLVSGNMRELTKNVFDREYEVETSHPKELFDILIDEGYNVTLDNTTIVIDVEEKLRQIWRDLPKICNENNFELRSFTPMRDSLENVFLKFVSQRDLKVEPRGVEL